MNTVKLATLMVVISLVLALNPVKLLPLTEASLFFIVIGVTYGVMSAFAISDVDTALDQLRDAFNIEVSALKSIYLLSKRLSDSKAFKRIASALLEYCNETMALELSAYAKGNEAHKKFHSLLALLSSVKVNGSRDGVLFDAVVDEARKASEARDRQIALARDRLPIAQWLFEVFLSVLLVFILTLVILPYNAVSITITALMMSAILLVLVVIYELDSMGDFEDEISNEPYRKLIALIQSGA